jgi:hypothetical protein
MQREVLPDPQLTFEIWMAEMQAIREENRHAGRLQAVLLAIGGAYLALGLRVVTESCAFQQRWGEPTLESCMATPWWVLGSLSVPLLSAIAFTVLLLADIMQRDFLALEIERDLHRQAGSPHTGEHSVPLPVTYTMSRRVWDDRWRSLLLKVAWYISQVGAPFVFIGFAGITLHTALQTPGWGVRIFAALMGASWAITCIGLIFTGFTEQRRWRNHSAWLMERMDQPFVPGENTPRDDEQQEGDPPAR